MARTKTRTELQDRISELEDENATLSDKLDSITEILDQEEEEDDDDNDD